MGKPFERLKKSTSAGTSSRAFVYRTNRWSQRPSTKQSGQKAVVVAAVVGAGVEAVEGIGEAAGAGVGAEVVEAAGAADAADAAEGVGIVAVEGAVGEHDIE